MKKILILLILLFSALPAISGEKEEQFESEFRQAIKEGDEAMLKLIVFTPDTPKLFREMTEQSLKDERKKKVKKMSFLDPAPDMVFEFDYEGVTYTTSLPVVKEFKITYDMTDDASGVDGTTYRLGLQNGCYRIVAPTPKK